MSAAFIVANTVVQSTALLPEIKLRLASEDMPIWQMNDEEREAAGVPLPYWAFAWAGGQALARYFLDWPGTVRGKTVLDMGAGCGLEAIAAAMAGARVVTAADTDPFAIAATKLNAELNGMRVETTAEDLIGRTGDWDIVMIGDLFFEQPLAKHLEAWLRGLHETGVEILIGDPQRTFLPRRGLEKLATFAVPTTSALEDSDLRNASVWRMVSV
ncbi:MAG: 50S ribosomal protein L11 methyltransferase [Alphaproteobacteria bacterium]|nr:50S ribosomal protein L11 methyltransferase [Alphaproteobacteria bacterium]